MTTINPYDGLISFQQALNQELIQPQLIETKKNYYIEVDKPNNSLRLTYALIIENKISSRLQKEVRAICQVVPAEPYFDRKVVFQIGCAVLEPYQNQGLGSKFVGDCLNIFAHEFITRNNLKDSFYFEAIIDESNIASQKLFEHLNFIKQKEKTDAGDFQYLKLVG